MVTDSRTVAEGQTGEAAAVQGYGGQAGICDLGQRGERQAVEVRVTHHLRRRETALTHDFSLPDILHLGLQTSGSHLNDAAVAEFDAAGEVQLLQPAEGQERGSALLFEQLVLRHQLGSLVERQTRRREEAHVAKVPGESWTRFSLISQGCFYSTIRNK